MWWKKKEPEQSITNFKDELSEIGEFASKLRPYLGGHPDAIDNIVVKMINNQNKVTVSMFLMTTLIILNDIRHSVYETSQNRKSKFGRR